MWRRGLFLILLAAGVLQAFTYEGPQDWADWFESANTLMVNGGFSGVESVMIHQKTLTLSLDGREISCRLPLKRDYAHLMPFFFNQACRLAEPNPLSGHARATVDLLSEESGIKVTFDTPERIILAHLYRDILKDDPLFLGNLWQADQSNGPGESLAAIDGFFRQSGLGDLGSRFHAEALKTLSEWFNLFQPDETIILPDHPGTLTLKGAAPLTVAGSMIETGTEPLEGLRLENLDGTGLSSGNLMLLYAPPLNEMEMRPLNSSLNVPLKGVTHLIFFRFNESVMDLSPPLTLAVTPLASYPARVEKVSLKPVGDQALLTFSATRTADVTAWVVLREDREGDEVTTTLSGMLPAVPDSLDPLTYQWVDGNSSNGSSMVTTYHLYTLTSGGFLSQAGSVTLP